MTRRRHLVLVVAAVAVAAAPALARADDPHPLTFAAAIDVSLDRSPALALGRATVGAADARLRATKALRLPSLAADANLFVWDKALELNLGDLPLPPGTDTTVRDRVTWLASVGITQPLTGLLPIGTLVGVDKDGADAARADLDATRLDVAARAGEAFLRTLQARAALDISQKTQAQIQAQLERAQILERGGVLGKVDLLRLESARDSARQVVLRTQASATTAVRGLALALGLPPETDLDIRDDLPEPPPAPRWTEEQAVTAALAARPELRAAHERIDQAEGARRAAMADYYPDVRAIATYQHSEGNGTFQPKDAYYFGLTLHWTLWDWQKTGAKVDEAAQHKAQAKVAAGSLRDQVVFEARRLALEAVTAHDTLEVAASALRAAEEAYRIQSISYQQGAATTTDVLESETEVARARAGAAVARYDYFLALSALARTVGELPKF